MDINALREQSPAYAALSDDELLMRLYKKFYADKMSYPEFLQKTGNAPLNRMAEETGVVDAAMIGAGKTFTDVGRGAQDLWYRATGDDAARAELAQRNAEEARLFQPLREASPFATGAGEMLPYLAVPGVGGAAGPLARIAGEAAIGGALGGLEYDTDMASGALGGAAGGALGGVLGAGLKRLGGDHVAPTLPAEHRQMLDQAKQLGWKTTPAQRGNEAQLGKLEAGLSRYPLTSSAFDRLAGANQDTANKIARQAIGEKPNGYVTDSVLEKAHERIGKGYDDLAPKDYKLDLTNDAQFLDELVALDQAFMRSPTRSDRWTQIRDRTLQMAEEPLTLKEYHQVTSDFAKTARSVGKGDNADPALERALYGVREMLDGAMERSLGPNALEALGELRGQYRALKLLEKPGVIKNGQVRVGPLRNQLKRDGKGVVRDTSDLGQVARIGEYFQPRVPTSGTSEGMAFQSMVADPVKSTLMGLGGNAIGTAYMHGAGSLGAGLDIGQTISRKVAPVVQKGVRTAALANQEEDNSAYALLKGRVPATMVAPLANLEWFQEWSTNPVKASMNTPKSHLVRLKLRAKGQVMSDKQREALGKLENLLKQYAEM